MSNGSTQVVDDGGTVEPVVILVEPREPVGVSSFLPRIAAEILVQAAEVARQHPSDSFERRCTLENAIVAVKARWPEFFRKV